MKTFGFRRKETFREKLWKKAGFLRINPGCLVLFVLFFIIFNMINSFSVFVKSFEEDKGFAVLKQNLEDIALCTRFVDNDFSRFLLSLDSVREDFQEGGNVIQENKGNISFMFEYLQGSGDVFKSAGFGEYGDFIDFAGELSDYKNEVYSLLGAEEKQSYIIAFENSGEHRPNGGFFGSFLLLTLNGGDIEYELLDSYQVRHDGKGKDTDLESPDWLQDAIGKEDIGFIASNVFGFTDKDGKNIKKIYEKTYPSQNIRGVLFLESEFLEDNLPGFREKIYNRQFVNASIDLIRGADKPFKKERYLSRLQDYLESNKLNIFKVFLRNFDSLLEERSLQVYLDDISPDFREFMRKKGLSTQYSDENIYFRDFNRAYNKIDRFVEKYVEVYKVRDGEKELVETFHNNIADVSQLSQGKYLFRAVYSVSVPPGYEETIRNLEEKYEIQMQEREKHILGLDYEFENKGFVYFPENMEFLGAEGEKEIDVFETDFSQGLTYKVSSEENHRVLNVDLMFEKK